MKKLFLILPIAALCCLSACSSNSGNGGLTTDIIGKTPIMTFTDTTHDFGQINQGETVSYTFKFKNTGKTDLVISGANGSCGCTIPSYPKNKVGPGEDGQIDVKFDSSGKRGKTEKMVTIITNCIPNTKILTITADIQEPKIQQ